MSVSGHPVGTFLVDRNDGFFFFPVFLPFCCCDKMPWPKSHVEMKGLIFAPCSRVQSIVSRKSWQQELEAAGHITSVVSEQREIECMYVVCLLSALSYNQGLKLREWGHWLWAGRPISIKTRHADTLIWARQSFLETPPSWLYIV